MKLKYTLISNQNTRLNCRYTFKPSWRRNCSTSFEVMHLPAFKAGSVLRLYNCSYCTTGLRCNYQPFLLYTCSTEEAPNDHCSLRPRPRSILSECQVLPRSYQVLAAPSKKRSSSPSRAPTNELFCGLATATRILTLPPARNAMPTCKHPAY